MPWHPQIFTGEPFTDQLTPYQAGGQHITTAPQTPPPRIPTSKWLCFKLMC